MYNTDYKHGIRKDAFGNC